MSPSTSARRNACSDAVARAISALSAAPRAPRPSPRRSAPPRAASAASTSATVSDGVAAGGGGSSRSDAQPTPEHALARRAREVAGARDALLRRQPAQRRREPLDLVLAGRDTARTSSVAAASSANSTPT